MAKLILIRAGDTEWQAQGRLAGDTDLQLNKEGLRQASADAQEVIKFAPRSIQCGGDEATKQTAGIIADAIQIKSKVSEQFREMDLGLWEGLTVEDFRERFSKVYRQWRSDPLAVEPPEGEAVSSVAARLEAGLEKILRRDGDKTMILVLGRFAYAAARCRLDDGGYEHFWEYVEGDDRCHALELDAVKHIVLQSEDDSKEA